jgi:hypothetical protein
MSNKNLEIHELSLKRILENLDKIPKNGRSFGNEVKTLSTQEKKELMELVSKYNEYGKALRCEEAIRETAETLAKIAKMAETYAMTESSDWFQGEVVKRDFKQANRISGDFNKLAQETYGKMQQLTALYEDMGHVLSRYYEINNMDEVAGAPAVAVPSTPVTTQEPSAVFGENSDEADGEEEKDKLPWEK